MLVTYLDLWVLAGPRAPPTPASIPVSATSGAASGKSLSLLVTLHSHLKNEGHNKKMHLGELLQTFSDSE